MPFLTILKSHTAQRPEAWQVEDMGAKAVVGKSSTDDAGPLPRSGPVISITMFNHSTIRLYGVPHPNKNIKFSFLFNYHSLDHNILF